MKTQTLFTCTNCDAQFSKWTGRCLECGKWSSIEKSEYQNPKPKKTAAAYAPKKTQTLKDVEKKDTKRTSTTIDELDRVLGGGIVPGSIILLGGEPGIGKSTLSLQLAQAVKNTLYISGEESIHQINMRANRLRLTADDLRLANESSIEIIIATIHKEKPTLAVIDSIQMMHSDEVSGSPGNVNQIRACTAKLVEIAKNTGTAICLIGHVTKDGSVAGPKTLEHLVDTVLYLEGDRHHTYRLLRTVKNRFGSTDEVGVFDMTETGLREVKNPSASFLEQRGEDMSGSVITCLMEGTRPMLIEIQALVNKTSFGYPVRKASGFDLNRLHVLVAVLEKRAGLSLGQHDIHLNVVGGIRAAEPAADLAVCLAIASSFKDKALGSDLVVFGEVGLGGEVRSVRFTEKRIKECEGLGMKRIIIAKQKSKNRSPKSEVKLIEVRNIAELIKHA